MDLNRYAKFLILPMVLVIMSVNGITVFTGVVDIVGSYLISLLFTLALVVSSLLIIYLVYFSIINGNRKNAIIYSGIYIFFSGLSFLFTYNYFVTGLIELSYLNRISDKSYRNYNDMSSVLEYTYTTDNGNLRDLEKVEILKKLLLSEITNSNTPGIGVRAKNTINQIEFLINTTVTIPTGDPEIVAKSISDQVDRVVKLLYESEVKSIQSVLKELRLKNEEIDSLYASLESANKPEQFESFIKNVQATNSKFHSLISLKNPKNYKGELSFEEYKKWSIGDSIALLSSDESRDRSVAYIALLISILLNFMLILLVWFVVRDESKEISEEIKSLSDIKNELKNKSVYDIIKASIVQNNYSDAINQLYYIISSNGLEIEELKLLKIAKSIKEIEAGIAINKYEKNYVNTEMNRLISELLELTESLKKNDFDGKEKIK